MLFQTCLDLTLDLYMQYAQKLRPWLLAMLLPSTSFLTSCSSSVETPPDEKSASVSASIVSSDAATSSQPETVAVDSSAAPEVNAQIVGETWIECAAEKEVCQIPYQTKVRFGVPGMYVLQDVEEGPLDCTFAVFGDPYFGEVKTCSYQADTSVDNSADWSLCSEEGEICSFDEPSEVRFGTDGHFISVFYKSADSVLCHSKILGDRIELEVEACYSRKISTEELASLADMPQPSSAASSSSTSVVATQSSSSSTNESAQNTSSELSSSSIAAVSSVAVPASETSQLADGADLYATQCASCHGDDGDGSVPVNGNCSLVDCTDQIALAAYIESEMPVGEVENCTDDCAQSTAAYIIEQFQTASPAAAVKPLSKGSWNVDLDSCDVGVAGGSQRLLPLQINNVIAATFNKTITPQPGYPVPLDETVFTTDAAANMASKSDVEAIADSAEYVAIELLEDYPALAGCPDGMTESCALSYIEELAEALYRGIYTEADVATLKELYAQLTSGAGALDEVEAVAGVVASMLQSPSFLYMQEIGEPVTEGVRRLTGREIANRIAFLTTNGPPDAELLLAAQEGTLLDPAARAAQAERLMGDSASESYLPKFFEEWFGVDSQLSGYFGADIAADAKQEFAGYVSAIIAGDQPVTALFGGAQVDVDSIVSDDLTDFYGPLDSQAGGVLTMAAVAAAHANLGGTSIVKRGHWVRETLLCFEMGAPPPGALEQNPELPETATVRDLMNARGDMDACTGCHKSMDSIGIGMEDLSELGVLRSTYEISGHPVDTDGGIADLVTDIASNSKEDVTFDGTAELAQIFKNSPAIAMCAREQWFTYAMGSSSMSQCHAASVDKTGEPDSPRKMLLDLVSSERFITRLDRAPTTPLQASE